MARSAIDHFINELNYVIRVPDESVDEPPVKFCKSTYRNDTTPNQNWEEARWFFELSETAFTKTQFGLETSRSTAYTLIPQLFENVRQSNCAVARFASLKALHALVSSGDKAIIILLLASGILPLALDILKTTPIYRPDPYMENYSVLILYEIFQKEDNGLDDVTKEGVIQQLIETGKLLPENPEWNVVSADFRRNTIWIIGKLFRTTLQPEQTTQLSINNKLRDFMRFFLEQGFIVGRDWIWHFSGALLITLSALNHAGQFQLLDTILCQGIQKMVEECPANLARDMISNLIFYFIDYPEDVDTRNLDISANKLTTLRKMLTNLATFVRETSSARMAELYEPISFLFSSFLANCPDKRHLIQDSGCYPCCVSLFAYGVKKLSDFDGFHHPVLYMMRYLVESATLEGIRCLFASGLGEAVDEYREAFKDPEFISYDKDVFDDMVEKLLVKLNQFQEFDLVQALLWPNQKHE